MQIGKSFGIWCLVFGIFLTLAPLPAQGIVLVPCGRSDQAGTAEESCNLEHLIILIIRMINYLTSIAAIVAMYFVVIGGFDMIIALGNPEKIEHGKETLSHAVIGFVLVILAFVFVNLAVNGLFGVKDGRDEKLRQWWSIHCIYNITANDCAIDP